VHKESLVIEDTILFAERTENTYLIVLLQDLFPPRLSHECYTYV
jgi:hypothetical protein